MSLFGKSAKQRLEQSGFTITKTLFEAPRLSMVPSLYMDENHRKWAIVLHGMEPAIHDYEDILDCKVIEKCSKTLPRWRGRTQAEEASTARAWTSH